MLHPFPSSFLAESGFGDGDNSFQLSLPPLESLNVLFGVIAAPLSEAPALTKPNLSLGIGAPFGDIGTLPLVLSTGKGKFLLALMLLKMMQRVSPLG